MDKDVRLLKDFISNVYLWLSICYSEEPEKYERSPWPVISAPPELLEIARQAWREFSEEYPLERLLARIERARVNILISHGLYGAQLRYKLDLVDVASRKAKKGVKGWRKKLIELIDVIIDSLGPTGIAGGLKELKDALTGWLPEE